MHSHPHAGRRWRRFSRKYGVPLLFALVLLFIALLVTLLMYVLSSPDWRARW